MVWRIYRKNHLTKINSSGIIIYKVRKRMNRWMIWVGFVWLIAGGAAYFMHSDHSHLPGMAHIHDLRLATGFIIANLWFIGSILMNGRQK